MLMAGIASMIGLSMQSLLITSRSSGLAHLCTGFGTHSKWAESDSSGLVGRSVGRSEVSEVVTIRLLAESHTSKHEASLVLQGTGTEEESVNELRKAVALGKAAQVTLTNYRRNGDPFVNYLSITPVHNDRGQLTHYVGVQSDITELVNHKKAELAAKHQAVQVFDELMAAAFRFWSMKWPFQSCCISD